MRLLADILFHTLHIMLWVFGGLFLLGCSIVSYMLRESLEVGQLAHLMYGELLGLLYIYI